MACACKVDKHITKIERQYGTNILPTKKTDISGEIKKFFNKTLIGLICLPFMPIIFLFVLLRGFFTKKPISIDKFIKKH